MNSIKMNKAKSLVDENRENSLKYKMKKKHLYKLN